MTDIEPAEDGFAITFADGTSGVASKVLLATGIVDELPSSGVEALRASVRHRLDCDLFEYAGKLVAELGAVDNQVPLFGNPEWTLAAGDALES